MGEIMNGRTYEGQPANFIELTGPCKAHVRFSTNGVIRTLKRTEWDLLPEWYTPALQGHAPHKNLA